MKHILVILFLVGFAHSSFSQELEENEHPIYLGLRAGANASNFTSSELDCKLGGYISLFVHFKISHFYRFQLEFGYSNQGGKSNMIDSNVKAEYFTIAPVNKLYLNNSGFHFIVFPSFEFDIDNTKFSNSENNGVNAFDIALGAGIGYETKSGLIIETRFKHGIIAVDTPFFKDNDSEEISKFNIVFQLGVSYKFKIKS